MKKAVCVILILAAVVLGAMHGHYTFLRSNGRIAESVGFFAYLSGDYKLLEVARTPVKKEPASPQRGREARRPLQPEKRVEETKVPAVEKIKPPAAVVDLDRVADLVKQGREFYNKSDYKNAGKRFGEAVAILGGASRKSSPHYREADNYSKRCRVFSALVGNIPFLELSDGQGLSQIELETGRTIVAKVISDDGDHVTIQQNDGIQATISYDQIDAMTPVSPADYHAQLKKEYRQRFSKADPKAYFDIFGVALFAIQNRLREEITPVLEKTFMLPGSELVLQTFYTGDDVDELIVALLESFDKTNEAQTYRERFAAAQAPPVEPGPPPVRIGPEHGGPYRDPEPPPAEPGPEPVVHPVAPVGPPGSKTARINQAGQYFAAGQRFANYATRNVSKRHFYGKKAYEELGKARDILNVLQDQNPGDMEIEQLLQQVSDLLQFVVHNLVGVR